MLHLPYFDCFVKEKNLTFPVGIRQGRHRLSLLLHILDLINHNRNIVEASVRIYFRLRDHRCHYKSRFGYVNDMIQSYSCISKIVLLFYLLQLQLPYRLTYLLRLRVTDTDLSRRSIDSKLFFVVIFLAYLFLLQ